MPIFVNFSKDGTRVEFISEGIVTGDEIIETNKKIYTRNSLARLKYKIIDRTACTDYRVTSEDVLAIANQDKAAAKINPHIVVLLISTTPVQYGMSRMWQAYTNETGFHPEIFTDRESADAWLNAHLHRQSDTAG